VTTILLSPPVPGVRFDAVTIEGAGDLSQIERPDETAAAVDAFLRGEPGMAA
jgi:pimeloyl-ACP methyl ester carboxylesterase